ncbi:hypothetical protein P167DRAFT_208505 [Morchella conica CCBAS932]|uniref:Secreted protein n=1 Tax=Morchella conica CCBAS932 TaxID=1392247 RepID=A0A3N4KLY7_9PEZI|nr:hypothetical protein P167DRAFT_208505 [Morchella conica CCBAS932]
MKVIKFATTLFQLSLAQYSNCWKFLIGSVVVSNRKKQDNSLTKWCTAHVANLTTFIRPRDSGIGSIDLTSFIRRTRPLTSFAIFFISDMFYPRTRFICLLTIEGNRTNLGRKNR